MAFSAFIPQIWDANMLLNFRQQVIAAAIANREYEGDATRGNTVKVATAVDIPISDYKAANRQTTPGNVDLTSLDLVIDQEKSFDFLIDDIDRVQAAGSMGAYTTSAALGMAEDADKYLLAQWVGAAATPDSATASISSGDAAYGILRDLRKTLNKAKVPQASRYVICNAEFEGWLLDASSKLVPVNTSGTSEALREGTLGRTLGFTIVTSENLPTVNFPQALAVYAPAVAFVSQIQNTEAMRDVNSFSDRLRGLHVYGAKVIRSAGLAVYTATA